MPARSERGSGARSGTCFTCFIRSRSGDGAAWPLLSPIHRRSIGCEYGNLLTVAIRYALRPLSGWRSPDIRSIAFCVAGCSRRELCHPPTTRPPGASRHLLRHRPCGGAPVDVDDPRGEQCQRLRHQEAVDDRIAERLADLRPDAGTREPVMIAVLPEISVFTESLADDASPSELRVAPGRLARVD
jgi:hypothetical protein